jgi:archaemetzincin
MPETHRPRRILRSIGAVLAGLLAIIILSIATDQALHATGVFPPFGQPMADALFLVATAYRIVYGVAGSYIAARLAPERPMQHALAYGVVGLVISTAGAVATWNEGPAFGPRWYALAIIAIALPCAWAGGRLRDMQVQGLCRGLVAVDQVGLEGGRRDVLAPIGPLPSDLPAWLAERLAEVFGRRTVIGEAVPLPAGGYDPRRQQYRGEAIIGVLRARAYSGADRVLGLTEADCYAPGLNFIFGQASSNGRDAFVALPRLRQSFYGLPEDPALFRQRALTEAVHELGHTWGLPHCPDPHCVMHFSNTLHDTDVKGSAFCRRCRDRLTTNGEV